MRRSRRTMRRSRRTMRRSRRTTMRRTRRRRMTRKRGGRRTTRKRRGGGGERVASYDTQGYGTPILTGVYTGPSTTGTTETETEVELKKFLDVLGVQRLMPAYYDVCQRALNV